MFCVPIPKASACSDISPANLASRAAPASDSPSLIRNRPALRGIKATAATGSAAIPATAEARPPVAIPPPAAPTAVIPPMIWKNLLRPMISLGVKPVKPAAADLVLIPGVASLSSSRACRASFCPLPSLKDLSRAPPVSCLLVGSNLSLSNNS